jgi:protein involved in polysaccharide export with SLBB domain
MKLMPLKFMPLKSMVGCFLLMILAQVNSSFASDTLTLRPGDSVFLSLPGESSLNQTLQIRRNGKILLPEVGEVSLGGLTIPQAGKLVRQQLQGMIHDLAQFELVLKKRQLMISVMGHVKAPGLVVLRDGANIEEAIWAVQGILPDAQLDKLQLRRQGKVLPVNYHSYLDSGDLSMLPALQSLDTLFIPRKSADQQASWLTVKPDQVVKIIGEVNNPGRYRWSDQMSLFDLIAHAGGPSYKGNIAKIKVLSKDGLGNVNTVVFDMATFINKGGPLSIIPVIKAQDIIVVPELPQDPSDNKAQWIRQSSQDSIYIMGEVVSPGRYMFNASLDFLDILSAAEGPSDKADIHKIRITHRNGTNNRVTHLDLGLYFETGDENLLPKVQTGDVIYIPATNRMWLDHKNDHTVRVLGAINKQGRYRYDQSMTILDLLAEAGGLTASAHPSHIVVVNAACCESRVSNFDLTEFSQTGDFALLPTLNIGDTVYVLNKEDSTWNRVLGGVQDTLSVLSIFRILGGG